MSRSHWRCRARAFLPFRVLYTTIRGGWYFGARVLIAEPIFRSYCAQVGRRFHTGVFVHWVQGRGRIIIGDDVLLDGKISFSFAARYHDQPTLRIGDRTGIGHQSVIVVGDEITIGCDCRIAGQVSLRDAPGHPLDADARRRGDPAPADAVKPIHIEDNVWIGTGSLVHAGVRIGTGSVIAAHSVVVSDVPPFSLMAGNPARRIGTVPSASPLQPERVD